jgi:hypothetical protein
VTSADAADEARLVEVATELADGIVAALPGWVERCVRVRCAQAGRPVDEPLAEAIRVAATDCAATVGGAVRELLRTDLDAQDTTPLALVRSAVRYPTRVLEQAGLAPVERDEFDQRAIPEDVFALAPASFADLDPSLAEPGLRWGAAKAFVHLARRTAEGRR